MYRLLSNLPMMISGVGFVDLLLFANWLVFVSALCVWSTAIYGGLSRGGGVIFAACVGQRSECLQSCSSRLSAHRSLAFRQSIALAYALYPFVYCYGAFCFLFSRYYL